MDLGLTGKNVLVTGSSRGIGLSIARAFLAEGARVALTGRDASALDVARSESLADYPGADVHAFCCDFVNPSAVGRLRKRLSSRWEGLDVLVANVGSGRSLPEPITEERHFQKVLETNLLASVNAAREFYPFLTRRRGCILFISSIAGIEAIGAPVDYATAKAGLMSFAKNLARRAAADGIRVNCVAPGNILFPGGAWDRKRRANPGGTRRMIASSVPMRRFGAPDEVAAACVFLCSRQAGFITGAMLRVDGGQTVSIF
ncbi:MAG: SDR family NAD(P)-dependent oxidoreductase [Elusimicrobiota bacterium]